MDTASNDAGGTDLTDTWFEEEVSWPCERCGTFAPLRPTAGAQLCQPCRSRRALRIDEDPPTVGPLLRDTWVVIRRLHWRLFLVVLGFQLPWALLWWAFEIPEWAATFWTLVTVVPDLAIAHMALGMLRGESPSLRRSLLFSLRSWPLLVAATLCMFFGVGVGLLFCLIPGVVLSVGLGLAVPIAGLERVGPIEACRRSWQRLDGWKWPFFWASLVTTLFAQGGDLLWSTVETVLWQLPGWTSLSDTSWNVLSFVTSVTFTTLLYPLAWIPNAVLTVVAYAKLAPVSAPAD